MSDEFVVVVEGLDNFPASKEWTRAIDRAARQAINATATHARTHAERDIRKQINIPAGYLSPRGERLTVAKRASSGDDTAIVRGRGRPTSLARFVSGSAKVRDPGVRVEVKPGKARYLRRAFLMKLKAGSSPIETRSNLGLAVRLRPGERLRNKRQTVKIASGLYLLYGPSVDQVFDDVSADISEPEAEYLSDEFARLLSI